MDKIERLKIIQNMSQPIEEAFLNPRFVELAKYNNWKVIYEQFKIAWDKVTVDDTVELTKKSDIQKFLNAKKEVYLETWLRAEVGVDKLASAWEERFNQMGAELKNATKSGVTHQIESRIAKEFKEYYEMLLRSTEGKDLSQFTANVGHHTDALVLFIKKKEVFAIFYGDKFIWTNTNNLLITNAAINVCDSIIAINNVSAYDVTNKLETRRLLRNRDVDKSKREIIKQQLEAKKATKEMEKFLDGLPESTIESHISEMLGTDAVFIIPLNILLTYKRFQTDAFLQFVEEFLDTAPVEHTNIVSNLIVEIDVVYNRLQKIIIEEKSAFSTNSVGFNALYKRFRVAVTELDSKLKLLGSVVQY